MSTAPAPQKSIWQRLWSVVDPNERYLRGIQPQVARISALEAEFERLSQQDLQDRLRRIRLRVAEASRATELEQQKQIEAGTAQTDTAGLRRLRKELIAAEKAVLDEHLVEVFAAVRETAKRTLSMRHFDVQLLGGIVLHEGRVAEMKTGEGKTLSATCPLVLNALSGRGAHLVTVNDYLARRDADWMGKIYRYLGLTVDHIEHDSASWQRQQAYRCDITYIANHEIGFDYLRDNYNSFNTNVLVLREMHYGIIDEVDSILIDEARVPLIISGSRGRPLDSYRRIQEIVRRLIKGEQDFETKATTGDFYVDEKAKNATLTEEGQRKVEIALGIENLNDSAHIEEMHLVNAALRANFCYQRDVDYIVVPQGGVQSVVIVDTFTGRPQPGRRWSDGLHQAIEAKENVPIQDEQQTVATVTYQNFFLMYDRLSGMTGTAKTEEAEFVGVYEMPVVVVPTNQPMIRTEHPDMVYKTEEWKFRGICCEIVQLYCRRQPVLVGTRSVETSELISRRLQRDPLRLALKLLLLQWHIIENEKRIGKPQVAELRQRSSVPLDELGQRGVDELLKSQGIDPDLSSPASWARLVEVLEVTDEEALRLVLDRGVPHHVLNARQHENEARIVAQAGRLAAVTIATNMAGRGTDIVLGGNPEPDVEALLQGRGIDHSGLSTTLFTNQALKGDADLAGRLAAEQGGLPAQVLSAIRDIRLAWRAEQKDVLAAGGLHILGTERLESRRIDNQLRGRSGRQGDPGSARFYVSLEDELMRLFGPDRWGLLMNQWPEEQAVEAKLITKAMGNAQRKVEGRNFEMRKNTLRYDDVMNVQRQHIYGERRRILQGKSIRETISHIITDMVDEAVGRCLPADAEADEWDLAGLWMELNEQFPLCDQVGLPALQSLDRDTVGERLRAAAEQAYSDKESDFLCAVGQWQLDNDLLDMEARYADRGELTRAVNAAWPLHDYLPARLEGVTEHRRRDAVAEVGFEAPVAAPRAFLSAVVFDRVRRGAREAAQRMAAGEAGEAALAGCLGAWPLELDAAALTPDGLEAACLAALADSGWRFVERAMRRQVEATIDAALEEFCDLEALIDELDALWPLGEDLAAARLAPLTFRAMQDRVQTMAADGVRRQGLGFLRVAAEHRLRRAFARAEGDPAEAELQLRAVLPPGVRPAVAAGADEAVELYGDELGEALALAAVEEAAVQATIAAHRRMAAGGGEGDDEEDLEYGDLRKMIERLNDEWAFEEALNPWELERLPPSALRRKMIEEVRGEVRTRGQGFVSAAARRRLARVVRAAVEEHHSLTALCNRLSREYELAGVFEPKELTEETNAAELIDRLTELASEAMEDDHRKLERFGRNVRRSVDEGISPRRLAERLNKELLPEPPLAVAELHGAVAEAGFGGGEEELQSYIVARLDASYERFEEQFVVEALHAYLNATIEEAIRRHYNLPGLSDRIWSTWPIPRDDVKPTRLAGWSHQDRPNELRARFVEANNKAPRAFLRRFVAKHLEAGLSEAGEVYCPAAARSRDWNLPGLCAELAERWPLTEVPQPTQLPTDSHGGLMDALLDLGRRAYRDAEQHFIRDTAWHRFAQRVDHLVAEHYCLQRACQAVNTRWGLGEVVQPEVLARVRAVAGGGRERLSAAVGGLIDQLVAPARETFLYESLAHRIESNIYEALWAKYSPERLLQAIAGSWPLPYGSPLAASLSESVRQHADEEHGHAVRVREFRRAVSAANGPLQRRLTFFNVCGAMAEVDPRPYFGAPGGWRVPAYVEELRRQLPAGLDRDLDAAGFALRLMQRALGEAVDSAVGGLRVADTLAVAALVLRRVEAHLDEPHMPRAPRELSFELAKRWPLGDRPDAASLRGQDAAAVRRAFLDAASAAYQAGPQAFLEEAAARWAAHSVHETIDRCFAAHGEAGPWSVAQTCHALNERWNQPDLLHPTTYRNLESEPLREALLEVANGQRGAHLTEQFLRELAGADLNDAVGAAALAALEGGAEEWQWPAFASRLQERWIGPAPTAEEVAAKVTPELLRNHVLAEAERLEPRVVREYGTAAVGDWLTARINRALDQFYSLREACDELSRRWPTTSSLYEARLARQYSDEVQNSLLVALFEEAKEGGEEFVRQAARLHLQADLDDLAAGLSAGRADLARVREHLREGWNVAPDLAALGALAVDEQAARVTALLPELPEAAWLEAFRRETVRIEIRLGVGRAQYQHCNPEHASDLWDREAFVAAIERDWPVAGRLSASALQDADASSLFNHSADVLLAAFAEDEAGFVERTTRHRVLNSLADVLPAHADLASLCGALAEEWPSREEFDPDALWHGRMDELEQTLLELVGGDPEQSRADVAALAGSAAGVGGEPDLAGILAQVAQRWPEAPRLSPAELDERLVRDHLRSLLWDELARDALPFVKRERLDEGVRGYEGRLMLYEIDRNWCDHLEAMDYLREGINLRGYGQTDPFMAYRKDGRQMFESMLGRVREGVIQGLFKTTDAQMLASYQRSGLVGFHVLEIQNVREQAAKVEELTAASEPREDGRGKRASGGGDGRKPVVVGKKVGRNDPCPCGSGRRYKDCCAKRGGVPDAAGR